MKKIMNVLEMYKTAENIYISNYKWTNTKARIFEIENSYYIALDNKQINNSIKEKKFQLKNLVIIIVTHYTILILITYRKKNVNIEQ